MTEQQARTTDVTFPTYVTATTGVVTWTVARWVFDSGTIPPEWYIWIQLMVPLAIGRGAAWLRLRSAARRPAQLPPT